MIDANVTVADNGNLVITADSDAREELADALSAHGFWSAMADILEPYFTNGGYEPFDAGDANPFVGLTGAPCIAESLDLHDDGTREIIGRFWFFANYMVECPLETLAETGQVVFQLAFEGEE